MLLHIWASSRAETFAYAKLLGYLHPDARPMAARSSVPGKSLMAVKRPDARYCSLTTIVSQIVSCNALCSGLKKAIM